VCRICLHHEGGGDLVAPCKCSGSIKYVHKDCLRTWRTQGSWHHARICSVCSTAYASYCSSAKWKNTVLRYPSISFATVGTAVLWALARLFRMHLSGAVAMHIVAPLQDLPFWRLWELHKGVAAAAGNLVCSGAVCLTIPALIDHLMSALYRGTFPTRVCELLLFVENLRRFKDILLMAWVRRSLTTPGGRQALECVEGAVLGALQSAHRSGVGVRRALSRIMGLCFTVLGLPRVHRPEDISTAEEALCLQLVAQVPVHLFVYMKVLGEQYHFYSRLQRWLPLLWHTANRDLGQLLIVSDLVFVGPVWGFSASLVRKACPGLDVTSDQMQHAFSNLRDFLCSAIRGSRALHAWALRLSL